MRSRRLALTGFLFAAAAALGLAACGSTASAGGGGSGITADAGDNDGSLAGADGAADAAATDDVASNADASGDAASGTDVASGTDATTDTGPSIDNLPCPSGQMYKGGSGNDMDPGNACIQCHSQGEGPSYTLAGTVFRNLITQSDCYASGTAGSLVPPATYTVEITDANGKVFKTTTSSLSGNFHFSGKAVTGFAPPYSARVLDAAGNVRQMVNKQTVGDCNTCHTANGANGAPGRIVAPAVP